MSKILDVYLHGNLTGQLIQDEHGQLIFRYDEAWLHSSNALPLSHSLPLQPETFTQKQCRGFFAGLLPEESKRATIAKNLGISKQNDYAMLEKIGGECAGAVSLLPENQPLPKNDSRYRSLSKEELAEVLRSLPKQPLKAGAEDVRLALAGAQDKIAVYVDDDTISIPLNGAPSTHILKPAIDHYEGLVINEAFCMKLASILGLPTATVAIKQVEDIDYLLVERYDRTVTVDNRLTRLHQEDFCQALGVTSERKYQNEGGPSLKQCFDLLRELSTTPVLDLQNLLNAAIFNFLIGNNDAHGKNFSLLYSGSGGARLAPLYDIVCTVYYPELSKKMAMKIGGEYDSGKVFPKHYEKLALEASLAKPIVLQRVEELIDTILKSLDKVTIEHRVANNVSQCIENRCKSLRKRFVHI